MEARTLAPYFFRNNPQRDRIHQERVDRALKGSRRFALEQIEPRLLLSANTEISGFAGALVNGLTTVSSSLQDFFNDDPTLASVVPGIIESQGSGEDAVDSSPTIVQLLDSRVDVDPNSDGVGDYSGGDALHERYEYIADDLQLLVDAIPSADPTADELALDAMDLDEDGTVTFEEAFNVLVVGQIEYFARNAPIPDVGDPGVDEFDVAVATDSFLDGLDVPDFLEDRFDLSASASSSSDTDMKFFVNMKFSFEHDIPIYLGYEAEQLGITLDPTIPSETPDPTTLPVDAGVHFKLLIFGLLGTDNEIVTNNDFIFAIPDAPSTTSDGMVVSVEIDDSDSINESGDPIDTSFEVNIGFVGANAEGTVELDMDSEGGADDPSNPDVLGFTLDEQGDASSSGVVTADNAPETFLLEDEIIFSLKVGTQAFSPVVEVHIPADDYVDMAGLVDIVDDEISDASSALGTLITTSDFGGKIRLSLPTTVDPSPIGFADEASSLGDLVSGVATVIGDETPPEIRFLLSVGGAVPQLITFTPGTADHDGDDADATPTPHQVTLATLLSALNAALPGAVTAVAEGTNKVRLQGGGSKEITQTLTLDTVHEITLTELASGNLFRVEANAPGMFEVELEVTALDGLELPDDSDFSDDPAGDGTIHVDIDPFDTDDIEGLVVDVNPTTGDDVLRATFVLEDEDGDTLREGDSDMQGLLDFNVILTADVMAAINQLGTWFDRLAGSDLLQKFDIPFAESLLGQLLNLKDLILDTLLFDDGDDGVDGENADTEKLLRIEEINGQEQLVPLFLTAQQLGEQLELFLDDIDPTYDPDTKRLTYNIQLEHIFFSPESSLDFDMDLSPLVEIETEGKVKLEATGYFNFTMGFVMGDAVPALDPANDELSELNGDVGVAINDHIAVTTLGTIDAIYGRLTNDAKFTVTIMRNDVWETPVDVFVFKSETNPINTLDQLVGLINDELPAGLTAIHDNQRIIIVADDGSNIQRFQVESTSGNTAFTELGLQPESASTVSLISPVAIETVAPGHAVKFTISIQRTGGTQDENITVSTSATNQNQIPQDLVDDINNALEDAGINDVVASHSSGRLVFSAIGSDVQFFSITPAGDNADEQAAAAAIGLDLGAFTDYLNEIGADESGVTALTAGVSLRAAAAPEDVFGRLTLDAGVEFTINGVTVELDKADALSNSSIDDLARDLNNAINDTADDDIVGKVIVENVGGRLVFRSIHEDVFSITLSGLSSSEQTELGLTGVNSVDVTLAVVANKAAPVSYGVNSNATFEVEIEGGDLEGTYNVTLPALNTINDRTLYDLAGSLNTALNVAFSNQGQPNPLIATVQAGQIVIGLRIGNGLGSSLFDLNAPIDNDLADVAEGITLFRVTATNAAAADQLKISSGVGSDNEANTADFIIYLSTNDGGGDQISYAISLDDFRDPADGSAPYLVGTIQELFDHISSATGGDVIMEVGDDHNSFKLIDTTFFEGAPNEFRIQVVNGSPAAIHLGIVGSDSSQLNVGTYSFNTDTFGHADGVIHGTRVASVDPLDRFFVQAPADSELEVLSADITVSTVDLDDDDTTPDAVATANFGFVGVQIDTGVGASNQNKQLFEAHVGIPLIFDGGNPLFLSTLFDKVGTITDLRTIVGLPTISAPGGDTPVEQSFDLRLSLLAFPSGSDAFLTIPSTASVTFTIDDFGSLADGQVDGPDGDVIVDGDDPMGVVFSLPDVSVDTTDLGDLLNFQDIEFDSLIDALKQISVFLNQFAEFAFLDQEIPLIGISVNDILEIADRFAQAVEDIEQNPAGGVQLLQQKILEAFNLPSFANNTERDAFFENLGIDSSLATDLIEFALTDQGTGGTGNDFLRFNLRLPIGFSEGMSIDLDLGEALADAIGGADLGPIDIQGGAGLNLKGFLDARLSFGIDLSQPDKVFLFDNATGVFGGLSASASNLDFNAAIGPLGAFIKDGYINFGVDFDLANSFNATSTHIVDITDLDDVLTAGGFAPVLTGTILATLPVYFPTDSEFLGDIKLDIGGTTTGLSLTGDTLTIPDFSEPGVLTLPDFSEIDLGAIDPFGSIPLMLDALDFLLLGLQDVVDGEVFGIELPLIGDQLASAAGFIDDLRKEVLAPIRQFVEQAPSLGSELIQKMLFSLLGPGSEDVEFLGAPLHEFLGLSDFIPGLGFLVDYDSGNPLPADPTESDIDGAIVESSPEEDDFLWRYRLRDEFQPPVDINFDLGWDALGLAIDAGLDVTLAWDLAMGVGISQENGAYIYIGDHRESGDGGDAELSLELDVLLQEGSGLNGRLAFLQLLASEADGEDSDLDDDEDLNQTDQTHFSARFFVDLQENGADDEEDGAVLTFSELGSLTAEVALSAEAEVDLDVTVQFNKEIVPESVTALIPSVNARFVLDWETGDILSDDFDLGSSLTYLAFKDVTVNMGSFVSEFFGPVLEKVQEVTEPLQPIIDVITAPIPVISDLAGQPITLIDIAGMTGYVEPAMIYAIADIIELINQVAGLDGEELGLNLGNFVLISAGGSELGANLTLPSFDLSAEGADEQFDLGQALEDSGLGQFVNGDVGQAFLDALNGAGGSDELKSFSSGMIGGTGGGSSGFKFPIFEDPMSIFGLLLGRNVDLVTYDLAPFGMDFTYTQKFPVWDALYARITGSAGLTIDLAFGYDTAGIFEFAEGGFSNPLDLLGGFFVSDTNLGTSDVPELVLRGELWAGAELNLGIASAGAEGGIILTVNFDLYDPDGDGKLRTDELLGNFLYEFLYGNPLLAPVAIFDVFGDVSAQLRMFVEALAFKFTFDITPPITLFEFSIPFEREPFLATERGDGSVLLNIGPNAAQRLNGDTRDISEEIFVRSLDGNTIEVWAPDMGVPESAAQEYELGENKVIIAYGGEGNDIINLVGVTENGITFLLEGGTGDDEIRGGQGGGTIKGDQGNDKLYGGDGQDLIIGGQGSDRIEGGDERDYIFGDTGTFNIDKGDDEFDTSDDTPVRIRSLVSDQDGADFIFGDDGDDIIFGGGNIDTIEGGEDDDLIFGDGGSFDFTPEGEVPTNNGYVDLNELSFRGGGDRDIILGNSGEDTILSGAGDDFADGGADDDVLLGGYGFDTLYGGSADDFIYGNENDDTIFGFRDPFVPTGYPEDTADNGNPDGEDYVEGGDGNDYIRGQGDVDTLHGNRGADIIFGDEDDDMIGAGILVRPWITGGEPVVDNEAGGDIIFGGANDDTIDAGDGGDIVFGDDGLVVYIDFVDVTGLLAETDIGSRIRTNGTDKLIGDGDATSLIDGYGSDDDGDEFSLDLIATDPVSTDGSDHIIGGDGKDVIFGGGSDEGGADIRDTIFGDYDPLAPPTGPRPSGQDLIIGDGGRVEMFGRRYNVAEALSNETHDGQDNISGNDGGDYIFGGGYQDTIWGFQNPALANPHPSDVTFGIPLEGVSENDVILGDNGEIHYNPEETKNRILFLFTTAVTDDSGRSDVILGQFGNDVILGGLNGSNDILNGNLGDDVLIGDQGGVYFTDDPLTTDDEGDNDLDTLDLIRSFRDGLGGDDIISGDQGNDVLIGGTAADIMYGDNATASSADDDGEDIMLGDNGDVVLINDPAFDPLTDDIADFGRLLVQVAAMPYATTVDLITTTDKVDADHTFTEAEDVGGGDTMSGNAGSDIMLGGVNNDETDTMYGDREAPNATTIGDDFDDIMLGDNGLLDFTFESDTDRNTLDLIRSFEDALGGHDVISGNRGQDVAIGGTGDDTIYGDDDSASAGANDLADLLLGDNADIFLVDKGSASGGDLKVVLDAAVKTIKTTDEEHDSEDLDPTNDTGGVDTISGNAGGDIIAGGVEGDTLYGDAVSSNLFPGLDGDDTILGDNGAFEWLSNGRLSEIGEIDIEENNPDLWAWFNGDAGDFDEDLTTLDLITTEQPNNGGRDDIFGDEKNDLIFGGTDLDWIHGDDGDGLDEAPATPNRDVLFGDHGRLYPHFSRWLVGSGEDEELVATDGFNSRNYFAIDIGDDDGGEGDIMYGEEGDDVMLGQQGDDRMWGGSDDDDMIGGHNVSLGYDELTAGAIDASLDSSVDLSMNDLMDGDSGDDAMAGDNAIMWRRGDDLSRRFQVLEGEVIYSTGPDGLTGEPIIILNIDADEVTDPGEKQSDPDDAIGRDIELIDHADTTAGGLFGADVMAGGSDSDVMFGELDNDLMQGDGSIDDADDADPDFITRHLAVVDSDGATDDDLYFNIPELASDADDYMEGNGGNDLMYGGLGQDDIIGGNSTLFGLVDEVMRPDGSDIIFGGAGAPARIVRNDFVGEDDTDHGTAAGVGAVPTDDDPSISLEDRHSRDADFIMGDNANVFRLVIGGASGTDPEDDSDHFLVYNYDQVTQDDIDDLGLEDRGDERIVVRGMFQIDYSLGGADYNGGTYVNGAADLDGKPADNGAADLIHGESGDDYIFGMTGSDVILGESEDDDIVGGYGHDWISGGTGQDGVLGDDGLIRTSRNRGESNPLGGEPLYAVDALKDDDPNPKYSHGDVLNELISTPGDIQIAVINLEGELKKTVDLLPFSYDSTWLGHDDEFPDDMTTTPFADDIIFGGLNSDWLHGGSGDDAISGAEALEQAYVPASYDSEGDPVGFVDLGYNLFGPVNPQNLDPGDTFFVAISNPGDVLAFNKDDLDGQHLNNRFRAGEFALYDEYDPLRRVVVDGKSFLLAFDESEGVFRASGNVPKATGQQTESYPAVNDDGRDAIFGDLGNDWIVGGTGRDDMYGGWGNDLINADDDQDVDENPGPEDPNNDLNDTPDTHPYYEDRAYGGAGRDVLIANTGGDRLMDWVGEYNSFLVPFAPFGQATVSRTLQPFLPEYLYALSAGDGADSTRYFDSTGDPTPPPPTNNNPNPSRNGEPFGELGLVLQQDFAWGDQTGAPADPQAGNIPGGPRDVLRTAGFNDGTPSGFFVDSGTWSVSQGAYQVAPESLGQDAVSVFLVDQYVPNYFEMLATLSAGKPTGGYKSNAYVIFDYQSETDFKFAGINVSTNKLEIGHRNESGWIVDKQGAVTGSLKADTNYNVFLSFNGGTVILIVDNTYTMTYTFALRVDFFGVSHGINDGMVGLGANNSKAKIDNVIVQRLRPATTFSQTVEFNDTTTSLFDAPASGTWTLSGGRYLGTSGTTPAIDLVSFNVRTTSLIDLSARFKFTGEGGFVYDQYSIDDFKFVTISAGKIVLGHRTSKGWFTDAVINNAGIVAGTDYTLGLTLRGTTVSVTLNGSLVASRTYNAVVTDGNFGLLSRTGTTSFDSVTVKSDDPSLLNQAFALTADSSTAATGESVTPITENQVAFVANAAMQQWASQLPADQRGILSNLQFVLVTDLPGDALAWSIGDGNVLIDMNAAGRGWFVDKTPRSSSEFFSSGNKVVANPNGTAGQMDLLSALIHEIGHVIGYEHSQGGTMDSTLAAGERRQLIDWSRTDLRAALGWNSTATSQKPAFPEFSIGMGKKKKSLLDPEVEGEGETLTQLDWYVEV